MAKKSRQRRSKKHKSKHHKLQNQDPHTNRPPLQVTPSPALAHAEAIGRGSKESPQSLKEHEPKEYIEIGIRCASSCSKAALTALIFGAIALAMWEPMTKARANLALIGYTETRVVMADVAKSLENDPCWQNLLETRQNLPSIDSDEISKATCDRGGSLAFQFGLAEDETGKAPPAFNSLSIASRLPQPNQLKKLLLEIVRSDAIHLYEAFPPRLRHSFKRWYPGVRGALVVKGTVGPSYLQALSNEELLRVLDDPKTIFSIPIGPLVNLSKSGLPDLKDMDSAQAEDHIALPSIPSPINVPSAAVLTLSGILLSIGYFFLFQLEAHQSPHFPLPGTFFSIFRRNQLSRLTFSLLAFLPSLAGLSLAWKTWGDYTVLNWGISISAVCLTCLVVYQEFRSKLVCRSITVSPTIS
jgi:hypothetical protein